MDVVFATETVELTSSDGVPHVVRMGTHWSANDPLVRAYPDVFAANPCFGLQWTGEPPREMSEPPVEQVTSRPGEKRAMVRRG